MDQEEIKKAMNEVKELVKDHGIDKAYKLIERLYKDYPEKQKLMLGLVRVEYNFYPFTKKRKA